jgi:ribosome recycling factor
LARKAVQKNVKESLSITESRLADIVREAAEKAKKKKKEETKKSDDTFQAEPELSSQIIRND